MSVARLGPSDLLAYLVYSVKTDKRGAPLMSTEARSVPSLDFERKPFYSTVDVAKIAGISDTTVLARIHSRELFAIQLGPRLYRIPLGALLQFLGGAPSIRKSADRRAKVNAKTDDPRDAAEH